MPQPSQDKSGRLLLSGNEASSLSALHCGVALGTGYPSTPSTEILEGFSALDRALDTLQKASFKVINSAHLFNP